MGEYGRVAAEAFRDEVYAREMLTIYERAAGMPTRGPGTARPVATTSRSDDRVEATWPS
jgi:hypothetical protein